MKISTKGRYAVRLLLDLALYNTKDPIALKDIAKRQGISEKHLEQDMFEVFGEPRADMY